MKRVILLTLVIIINLVADDNKTAQQKLDPVYKLELDKYPKFSTELILKNGKKIKFSSVKSMMNFYFHPEKYPKYGVKSRTEIDKMFVRDYITGKKIDAKDAFYIFGSKLIGPHGDDLIPLSSKTQVELFMKRYGGSKVLRIDKFTFGLIKYLDM
jgi:nitrous oxide reductase accessory protein NosL